MALSTDVGARNQIEVVIVEDSMMFREGLARELSRDALIHIAATATDPNDARDKIVILEPDVVIADVAMSKMDGVEFVRRIMARRPVPIIVMASSSESVRAARDAGAIFSVLKPAKAGMNYAEFISDMKSKVKAAPRLKSARVEREARTARAIAFRIEESEKFRGARESALTVAQTKASKEPAALRGERPQPAPTPTSAAARADVRASARADVRRDVRADVKTDAGRNAGRDTGRDAGRDAGADVRNMTAATARDGKVKAGFDGRKIYASHSRQNESGAHGHTTASQAVFFKDTKVKVIAVGASTGGTEAIVKILKELPNGLPPIVIVQHMPPDFTGMFAARIDSICAFGAREAEDGMPLVSGNAYVAPGGYQFGVTAHGKSGLFASVTSAQKVNGHAPSVDVLFSSVAAHVGGSAVGVILTGMGRDGAEGLLSMRKAGARTFGQDEGTSVVYGMPKAAYDCGAVMTQLPVGAIAQNLVSAL